MPSLMSMEDLFYGPPETTFILPTRDESPPRRYIEREIKEREIIEPPRRQHKPEPLRAVERYIEPPRAPVVDREIRPIERLARVHKVPEPVPMRAPVEEIRKVVEVPVPVRAVENRDIRPIERLARVHTAAEPLPLRAPAEEIRKVVEVPVPVPVEVPVPVPVEAPPPTVHVHAPSPPRVVEVVNRSITPPVQRPLIHHPIELKVPMCCEKCAKKVKDRLLDLEGVEDVVTDQYNQKVTIYGHVDPARVLNRVRLVKKRSAFWDMTVDYSQEYRRFRQAQADAARADAARAEVAKAKAVEKQVKAMVAPSPAAEVVVSLPQEPHEPKVTAILPTEKERAMPYVATSRVQTSRYVSPPRAYRQEFYHGHRQDGRAPQFYDGRHADRYF